MTARVLDLGPAGAHIETTSALRVGEPYAFTLEVSGTSRRLRGRVRWCRLVATRAAAAGDRAPIYRAGVVWSEPQPAAARADAGAAGRRDPPAGPGDEPA